MESTFAHPGQIVDVWSTWSDAEKKATLLRTIHMEIMRLHLNAGARIPTFRAQGGIVIHCLQGCVEVLTLGDQLHLKDGQLLYLLVEEPFELQAAEETSLLITVLRPNSGQTFGDDRPPKRQ
jgi:hypothetical protein